MERNSVADAVGQLFIHLTSCLNAWLFNCDPPIAFLLADPVDELGNLRVLGEVFERVVGRFELRFAQDRVDGAMAGLAEHRDACGHLLAIKALLAATAPMPLAGDQVVTRQSQTSALAQLTRVLCGLFGRMRHLKSVGQACSVITQRVAERLQRVRGFGGSGAFITHDDCDQLTHLTDQRWIVC